MWNCQVRHTDRSSMASTRGPNSVELEPDEEFWSKFGETCHSEFCHWHWFEDIRSIQYSFCSINFIEGKSESEIVSNVTWSSREWVRWKAQTKSLLLGEFWSLHQWTHLFFWEKITRRICTPSETQIRSQLYRNCLMWIVRCDPEIDSRTKFGHLRSVRIKLVNFFMGKAVPGEWRRGNQAHEGKSLRILRLCIVCWKDVRVPTI